MHPAFAGASSGLRCARAATVLAILASFAGPALAQRGPEDSLTPHDCSNPPHRYSCLPPRLFLAFSFAAGDIWTRPDRADFYPILQLHYNTTPTQASTLGHIQAWANYRREVLSANPSAILGIYFSAITTQNPTTVSAYSYPPDAYIGTDFLCDNPASASQYDPRPDDYGFYSPRITSQRADWSPWGPGSFGRWPFYEFKARGWILPQTTYVCRPVINFANPDCQAFVIDRLQRAIVLDQSSANAIAFDNAEMVTSNYGRWPGYGARGSWYRTRAPDADFKQYLDAVREGLHEVNARLIVNTEHLQELAPHTDVAFFEGGIQRSMSTQQVRELIEEYRTVISAQTVLVQRYLAPNPQLPLDASPDDLRFFLASSLLVYEPGSFAVDLLITRENFRFYPEYFMLPSWLGDALGPYVEWDPGVYVRHFMNGVVMLNASDRRYVFTPAKYAESGLGIIDAPRALTAHSSVIKILDCHAATAEASCPTLYQNQPRNPPILHGDMNCDDVVNLADHTPFLRAMLDPTAYAAEFPYCSRTAADMNDDGAVDQDDYALFYTEVFHNGVSPQPARPGDLNCDGYIDNMDIDAFLLALVDPTGYEARFPECNVALADLDGDGNVTYFDTPLFLNLLLAPAN